MERFRQEVAPRARRCSPEPPRSALLPAAAARCAGSFLALAPARQFCVSPAGSRGRSPKKTKERGKTGFCGRNNRGVTKKKKNKEEFSAEQSRSRGNSAAVR